MRGGDTPCEVHVVADTHDWYKFFAPMSFMIHGMAIMDSEAAMNHSMRFIRRGDLKNYQVKGMAYDWEVEQVLHNFSNSERWMSFLWDQCNYTLVLTQPVAQGSADFWVRSLLVCAGMG